MELSENGKNLSKLGHHIHRTDVLNPVSNAFSNFPQHSPDESNSSQDDRILDAEHPIKDNN